MTTTAKHPVRPLLTPDGARALHDELKRLRHQLEADFSRRLKEARDFGDVHANDDYLQIKEEEAVLRSRIGRLEALLDWATVVEDADRQGGVVCIGSTVKVKDLASSHVREHRLTGGHEHRRATDISANSPIGQALIGGQRGDEVAVALPDGRSTLLEIVGVSGRR
jgi:transcription elongation factor GreA